MTSGYVGNRQPGLCRLRQDRQLLVQRVPSAPLDARNNLDSINIRHSRITGLTPSLSAMQLCPVQMGPLQPPAHNAGVEGSSASLSHRIVTH